MASNDDESYPFRNWTIRTDVPEMAPSSFSVPLTEAQNDAHEASDLMPYRSWTIREDVADVAPEPISMTIPLELQPASDSEEEPSEIEADSETQDELPPADLNSPSYVRDIADLSRDIGDFASLPYLSALSIVVLRILAISEMATINKKSARLLTSRAGHILYILKDVGGSNAKLAQEFIEGFTATLKGILTLYESWSAYSKLERVLFVPRISEEILACHAEIDQCLYRLRPKIHFASELFEWQQAAEKARIEDREEIIRDLDDEHLEGELQTESQLEDLIRISNGNEDLVSELAGLQQEAMYKIQQSDKQRVDAQQRLYCIKEVTGTLPPGLLLKGREVSRVGDLPVSIGERFDIYEGWWMNKEKVALKMLRGVKPDERVLKRFERESKIWRQVWEKDKGKHFLAFYGTVANDKPYPYMVSPWQENGTARSYCAKRHDVDLIQMITGIAKGIEVLHTWDFPIIHGDIQGKNILIGSRGQPLIANFSLSKILENVTEVPFTQERGISDSFRWWAPEVCSPPMILTTGADMFALAMTVLELFTNADPFAEVRHTTEVLFKLQQGLRPRRPSGPQILSRGLTDKMWALLQRCWGQDYTQRISIQQFLQLLETVREP